MDNTAPQNPTPAPPAPVEAFRPAHASEAPLPPILFDVEVPIIDPSSQMVTGTTLERFAVPRPVPFGPMMRLSSAHDSGDDKETFQAFAQFVAASMADADIERFYRAITAARWQARDLLPLARKFLTEEAGGLPLDPLSSSLESPPASSPSSSDADSSPATTGASSPSPTPSSWPQR